MNDACCNCGDNATHNVQIVKHTLAYCEACHDREYHSEGLSRWAA